MCHQKPLTDAELKEMQEIVGVFLFDPTMLTAINKIAFRQLKPTSLIKQEIETFLAIRKQLARRNNTYSIKQHEIRLPQ